MKTEVRNGWKSYFEYSLNERLEIGAATTGRLGMIVRVLEKADQNIRRDEIEEWCSGVADPC